MAPKPDPDKPPMTLFCLFLIRPSPPSSSQSLHFWHGRPRKIAKTLPVDAILSPQVSGFCAQLVFDFLPRKFALAPLLMRVFAWVLWQRPEISVASQAGRSLAGRSIYTGRRAGGAKGGGQWNE